MFRTDEDYDEFAEYIRRRARYILGGWQQEFINAVLLTSKKRTAVMQTGQVLWRAALGYVAEEGVSQQDVFFLESIDPHPLERMMPLKDRAQEGRVNPKGIPCLYAATDAETAMMETRPWVGSVLSVSELVLLRQVTVVDCSLPATFELLKTPTQEQLESNNWHVINNAFSEPVSLTDDVADYAPTQFLAEAFQTAGYDGIIYTSQMGNGKNVALFDVNVAEVASRQLRQVKKLSFAFRKVGATAYVEKYKAHLAGLEQQDNQTQMPEVTD
jgi:RES domain-containing protein